MSIRLSTLAICLALAACGGGGSPTTPTPSSPSGISVLVAAAVGPTGTFSATLNGQTYTTQNGFTVSLPAGTHEMSGSYTGGTLIVAFTSIVPSGGVQTGSVRSTVGPVLTTTQCGVAYSARTGAQTFRLQFTVGTNANTVC